MCDGDNLCIFLTPECYGHVLALGFVGVAYGGRFLTVGFYPVVSISQWRLFTGPRTRAVYLTAAIRPILILTTPCNWLDSVPIQSWVTTGLFATLGPQAGARTATSV
jgi:hypothetical protein